MTLFCWSVEINIENQNQEISRVYMQSPSATSAPPTHECILFSTVCITNQNGVSIKSLIRFLLNRKKNPLCSVLDNFPYSGLSSIWLLSKNSSPLHSDLSFITAMSRFINLADMGLNCWRWFVDVLLTEYNSMPKGKNSAWELMLKAHHTKLKRKNLHLVFLLLAP